MCVYIITTVKTHTWEGGLLRECQTKQKKSSPAGRRREQIEGNKWTSWEGNAPVLVPWYRRSFLRLAPISGCYWPLCPQFHQLQWIPATTEEKIKTKSNYKDVGCKILENPVIQTFHLGYQRFDGITISLTCWWNLLNALILFSHTFLLLLDSFSLLKNTTFL